MPESPTPYRIKVHNMECCNCNHGCGCQFAGYPDNGNCHALMAHEVIEGSCGEVDLAGARVAFGVSWPKAIHEGHGRGVMFADENLHSEQVEALGKIYSGQLGGMPWEALAATFDEFEGPILKPIEMTVDGRNSQFRIPGVLEVGMKPLRDVMSGEPKDVHITFPGGGFMWDDGHVGTAESMRISHGAIQFEYPGRFSVYSTPVWTNQA